MTNYPLEFYLCLKDTPHIKIVDWNNPVWIKQPGYVDNDIIIQRHFERRYDRFVCTPNKYPWNIFARKTISFLGWSVETPTPKQHVLAEVDSDDHLLLVLKFGEVEWLELGEEEALAMMHGELAS